MNSLCRRDLVHVSGETLTLLKITDLPRHGSDRDRRHTRAHAPASSLLSAGQDLGPYRLLEWLGQGAQGDVWKARRPGPVEEFVALKVLKPSQARNAARMAQFRREAERGLRLVGPSLLTIQELIECDGYHFMTMPFVQGTPLREVIKCRFTYLSGEETATPHHFVTMDEKDYLGAMTRALAEAARALERVHEARIVHRDIKPANILLDNRLSGRVYLCDFGLGRDLDFATPDQMRDGSGTPLYMAPERLLKSPADEIKCDIYSMGVTLCEALTLERPFRVPVHVSAAGLAPYLARAEPRRPCRIDPGFPGELEAIIMKAMARDPRHRHDSARVLADDLERFADAWSSRRRPSAAHAPHKTRVDQPHVLSRRVVAHGDVARQSHGRFSSSSNLGTKLNADPINDYLAV